MLGISINKRNRHMLAAYVAAGFTHAELSLSAEDGLPSDMTKYFTDGGETAAMIQSAGLELRSVHLPFATDTWNPSNPDDQLREAAVLGHCALMHAAASWGASYVVIHVSCGPVPDEERPEWETRCTASIRQMADSAQACGVRILAENLPVHSLVNGSAPLLRVTEEGRLADICFDVNHLFLESHAEFIQAAGPWIRGVHLSDYDGVLERHWIPGMGIVPWRQVVEGLREVGYDGPWLFELRLDDNDLPYDPATVAARFAELTGL